MHILLANALADGLGLFGPISNQYAPPYGDIYGSIDASAICGIEDVVE